MVKQAGYREELSEASRLEVEMGQVKSPMFWMLVLVMILTAIVAAGNWQLYGRVAHLEATRGAPATPQ